MKCKWFLTIVSCYAIQAGGEVIVDNTYGNAQELTGSVYDIRADHGKISGNNLFHSFSKFNLTSQERAVFSGPDSIDHVIARITDTQASSIDGQIESSIVGADLYLLNPNGFIFGQNASLNIPASLYISTADQLVFEQNQLHDVRAQNPVLPTGNPVGFMMGENQNSIQINGSRLSLAPSQSIGLVAGQIRIHGRDTDILQSGESAIDAVDGSIFLLAKNSQGYVSQFEEGVFDGKIELNQALITASGNTGGMVTIRGASLQLSDSLLQVENQDFDHPGNAFDIDVSDLTISHLAQGKSETSEFAQRGGIRSVAAGSGKAGNIKIKSSNLQLYGDSQSIKDTGSLASIESISNASGDSGRIEINSDTIGIGENSTILTQADAMGSAQSIYINANTIDINNPRGYAGISSHSNGGGNAGDVSVRATNLSVVGGNGLTGIESQVRLDGYGTASAGHVDIESENISLINGGKIAAGVLAGAGTLGNIKIVTKQLLVSGVADGLSASISINGLDKTVANGNKIQIDAEQIHLTNHGSINTAVANSAQGAGIEIKTDSLLIDHGAFISSTAFGSGDAGNIQIDARSAIIQGATDNLSGIFASTSLGNGDAGNILMKSESISIENGGEIQARTMGGGQGGNIQIDSEFLTIKGKAGDGRSSGISTETIDLLFGIGLNGDGGEINITSSQVSMADGGFILADSRSPGSGGNIHLNTDKLYMTRGSRISANSEDQGLAGNIAIQAGEVNMHDSDISTFALNNDGGNIKLNAESMIFLHRSQISTDVKGGDGNGGNIEIDPEFVILNNSSISARSISGRGGNIHVQADNLFRSSNSNISASSSFGLDGSVYIEAPVTDVDKQIQQPEVAVVDASPLLENICTNNQTGYSTLRIEQGLHAYNLESEYITSEYQLLQE